MMTPLKMLLSVAFATTALTGFAQHKAPVFTPQAQLFSLNSCANIINFI